MIIVVMGVSGCGKTTIGRMLAERLNLPFYDADEFHPPANVAQMKQGLPLTDADRAPWLRRLTQEIADWDLKDGGVLACSALKESYRRTLGQATPLQWVYLKGSAELIRQRMRQRQNHYMPVGLLESQLTTLEEPHNAIVVDISGTPQDITESIYGQISHVSHKDKPTMKQADIGLWGLAVMGENLVLNMEEKGFTVAVYNRTPERTRQFVQGAAKGKHIIPAYDIESFIASLSRPRKVMLMVKAGSAVDDVIGKLLPYLEKGDLLIDGGNSHFVDTLRRCRDAQKKGLLYLGTGVSGGEEGARNGPSIMPGGSREAWEQVKPIFQKIAAHTPDGQPCCEWVGENGAGHFVKMIHNGIEYGDMQMICETYQIMRHIGLSNHDMHDIFTEWNQGELNSYLIEITRDILGYRDEQGQEVIDLILDTAGQKGTGKWTVITALDTGMPLTLIGEAVFARSLSALQEERLAASKALPGPQAKFLPDRKAFLEDLRQALYASKIVSYAQGYQLMRAAAKEYQWDLNYGGIALMWRGGCIIRSVFLGKIKEAFDKSNALANLLLDPFFQQAVISAQNSWRHVIKTAVDMGVPVPALSSALAYFDGYRCPRLPANLLQAQRDYFGAHTYERVDRPRGEFYHTNWTGRGGTTAANTYNA